ncbi:FAD binding domain protein [Phlyctema vagabunda]|uniref:FAD binding domain protein n=1 Tax=Phlyctema vagabunda TaxID=108571 RepID=A0ABR4P2S6_9HELO
MAPMKILISGGGIAGIALAYWLSKLGHNVTVVERFSSLRTTGLQIDLRGHGIEVLKRMGLEEAFRSKSAPEQGLQIVDKAGRQWAYFPANRSGQGSQSFTTDYEIMRGDFCRLMYEATKDRVNYIFGTSVESYEEKNDSINVHFANGTTAQFELLVGADGQSSRTRKMMVGADTAFSSLGGDCIAYFTIPRAVEEGEQYKATMYMAPGKGVMTRRHNPREIQVYLSCTLDSERLKVFDRKNMAREKEVFIDIFRGAGWQTDAILESMIASDNFYCQELGLVKLDSWSSGRVTLVGDAAYCPSPNTGMGTTSSIVGAYILAGEIGRQCGVVRKNANNEAKTTKEDLFLALENYERNFQPFMSQVQAGVSEGHGWDFLLSTPIGIFLMNCFLGIASFFKINIFDWMLKENVKGWELPDYKEMQDA